VVLQSSSATRAPFGVVTVTRSVGAVGNFSLLTQTDAGCLGVTRAPRAGYLTAILHAGASAERHVHWSSAHVKDEDQDGQRHQHLCTGAHDC